MFAKFLVEVRMDQSFPKVIHKLDEKGCIIEQKVTHNWLPTTCIICHIVGHTKEQCHKNLPKGKRIWVPKARQPQTGQPTTIPTTIVVRTPLPPVEGEDTYGFVLATSFSKNKCNHLQPVHTGNKF